MISLSIVILLIILAIGLILVEIFLVPGVGIPGIAGTLLLLLSLILAYQIDNTTGHYTLASTIIISVFLIWLTFRSKTWDRLSQKEEIKSKVQSDGIMLHPGDIGIAMSRLNPIGTGRFGDVTVEVSSQGEYIDAKSNIEIITIEANKIFVKSV